MEKEISQCKVSNMELKGNPLSLNKLKEICENSTIFVFSFGDTGCEVCIDDAFKELSKFPNLENERFIVLTNIRDAKQFNAISNLHNKYLFINVEGDLYLDNANKYMPPVFFILNSGELKPKNLFFYIKEVPELNRKYFEFINSTYF
jgi:rRNA maturation protein Rpf1